MSKDFPDIGGLMISKLIMDEGRKPMFMYREKRERDEDSGWRIFSGEESDEYVNQSENIGIYHAKHILEIEPSLENLLLSGIGSVYERKTEESDWYRVDDFELEDDFMIEDSVGENWIITINNLFEKIEEEGNGFMYTTGDKSVRIAIWNLDQTQEEIYQDHTESIRNRDESESKTLMTYDFSDSEIIRVGYQIEESDERRTYKVIYGYSIINRQVVQIAFYFDKYEDESWAIETWKKIKKI